MLDMRVGHVEEREQQPLEIEVIDINLLVVERIDRRKRVQDHGLVDARVGGPVAVAGVVEVIRDPLQNPIRNNADKISVTMHCARII